MKIAFTHPDNHLDQRNCLWIQDDGQPGSRIMNLKVVFSDISGRVRQKTIELEFHREPGAGIVLPFI